MHIPDGFLNNQTIVVTTTLSAISVSTSLKLLKRDLIHQQVPMMGLTAAFIFVAQMLNFPVLGGTSGHLIGSVFLTSVLGPNAAILVMTSVLVVQAFLFADGGILALGANILNMAVIGTMTGYLITRLLNKIYSSERSRVASVMFAAWLSTVVVSIFCAAELSFSGTTPWKSSFPAMVNIHMLIGIGESLITGVVFIAILKFRPFLVAHTMQTKSGSGMKEVMIYGLIIILSLLLFVTPFISDLPDGLDSTARFLGFEGKAEQNKMFTSPFTEYRFPGDLSAESATVIAGIVGTAVVFGLSFFAAKLLVPSVKKK